MPLGPGEMQFSWAMHRADAALGDHDVAEVPELSDELLTTMADQLHLLEREVSAERRVLHDILDTLQGELVRRYRTGEATVDGLLR